MLLALAAVLLVAAPAGDIPLPRPRPAIPETPEVAIETPHGAPSECDQRLAQVADFEPKPTLEGPRQCGSPDLVLLKTVHLSGVRHVSVEPPAMLRCEMAESFSAWVRDEVAPRLAPIGGGLKIVQHDSAYECRNRNRAATGKISEHAHGLAIDVKGLVLADKQVVAPTDVNEPKPLRAALRETACQRFTTVLGPGEPAHDGHIHLDIIQRHGGYRICSWDVREPIVADVDKKDAAESAGQAEPPEDIDPETEQTGIADVPLPRPRRLAPKQKNGARRRRFTQPPPKIS